MNRLESIKGRIDNYKSEYLPYFNNNGEMMEWSEMFGDLQYLLQRLEIAQKALESVVNVIHVQGENRDIGEQSQWDEALLFKVREALDQLKE